MTTSSVVRLLVVEDNAGDARLVELALRHPSCADIEARFARSMKEALGALRHGGVDIVLLDLFLPDAEGIDGVRRLRAAAPGLPILVLSGSSDPGLLDKARAAGAVGTLPKEVHQGAELSEALHRALAGQAPPRAVPVAAPEGSVIDGRVLDDVRALAVPGEEEELVHRVVEAFEAEGKVLLGLLEAEVKGGDVRSALKGAHAFRSVSLHAGARVVAQLLEEVDRPDRPVGLEQLKRLMPRLQRAFEEATLELHRRLGPAPGAPMPGGR